MLKSILPIYFYVFNVATTKFKIIYVAHIPIVLGSTEFG